MALISCPECRHEVSDKAPYCPSCGHPLAAKAAADATVDSNVAEVARTGGKVATTWLVAGQVHWVVRALVAIVAIVGLFLFLTFAGSK